MNTDPIADLLTRIRNAQTRGHETVVIPHSKIKEKVTEILKSYKFINNAKAVKNDKFKEIEVTLNKDLDELTLKRISKPGQRIYVKSKEIQKVKNGLGISIISTSKGIMTTREARKQGLGGEVICQVY